MLSTRFCINSSQVELRVCTQARTQIKLYGEAKLLLQDLHVYIILGCIEIFFSIYVCALCLYELKKEGKIHLFSNLLKKFVDLKISRVIARKLGKFMREP